MKHVAQILAFALALAWAPALAAVPKYRVEFIGEANNTSAFGLNDLGEVTGYHNFHGPSREMSAFLYRNGQFSEILDEAAAFDINNRGEVVGWASPGPDSKRFGFLYRDGNVTDVTSALVGVRDVVVRAINNRSHAIGNADGRPFFYDGGTSRYLGLDDFNSVVLFDVNDHDAIVGAIDDINMAFVYQRGQLTILPALSNNGTVPHAINNAGQVVGASRAPTDAEYRPVLIQDDVIVNLGALPGKTTGLAYDINEKGWIVGVSANSVDIAGFLYRDGRMHDLNDLLWGDSANRVQVLSANNVNEAGQLLVLGRLLGGHPAVQPLLLTPIPEPAAFILMLAGLGLIGVVTKRRP